MNFIHRSFMLLATWFGAGCLPWAPGTWGSLFGLPLPWALSRLQFPAQAAVIVLFVLVAVWSAGKAALAIGNSDPSRVVIDEVAGMAVSLAAIPFSLPAAVAGFVLFRFFDILKPFPIRQLERRFKGGFGIVLDDVLAGMLANISLRILILFFPFTGPS